MKYRLYVYSFTLMLIVFVVINFAVWKCCAERLFSTSYGDGGDLARLGYLTSFKLQRKNHDDLPLRHISLREYVGQPVDILTVGDSFSNGGGKGKNTYYQDYIATINRMSVLNIGMYKGRDSLPAVDPVQTLLLLINTGELDRIAPRTVLISVSVKQATRFLAHPMEPDLSAPIEKIRDARNYNWYDGSPDTSGLMSFISSGNFNYLYYTALHRFAHKTPKAVAIASIDRKLFSVEGKSLLYLREDVNRIASNNKEELSLINANLNQLAALLAKRGIRLYFMPCVDKYDLYSPFIVDNKKPRNNFFDIFRQLHKEYTFVDTKKILAPLVEEGVQDVYYPDDTHWSWKAAQRIFETVRFR